MKERVTNTSKKAALIFVTIISLPDWQPTEMRPARKAVLTER